MRLSKLTSFLSSCGASLVVGMSSVFATPLPVPKAESRQPIPSIAPLPKLPLSPATDPQPLGATTPLSQDAQPSDVADDPLCQLIMDTATSTAETVKQSLPSKIPAQFSTMMSGLLRKLMQVMGLERLIQAPTVSQPTVAVIPKSLTETETLLSTQSPSVDRGVKLVSNTTTPDEDLDYQLWVKGKPIANIRSQEKADHLAQRLERLVNSSGFNAAAIAPKLYQEQAAIAMGDQILFVVDESITRKDAVNYEVLAIQWANNLRVAFNVPALDLVTAQRQMYQVEETDTSLEGLASWYGPYFHGRLTANGETYDQYAFTAAHPSMPLNTYLKVTNLNNDKSVIIRLNDRGPYIEPRSLDLSLGAAHCLNSVSTGVIPYKATIMQRRPAIATEAI